jgi:hypothetical protein
MRHALESSKAFPIIAWSCILGFALLTYTLTLHLKAELGGISSGVERVEARLDQMEREQMQNEQDTIEEDV